MGVRKGGRLLWDISGPVVDGQSIDWMSVKARVSSRMDQARLEALLALSQMLPAGSQGEPHRRAFERTTVPAWVVVLARFSLVQSLVGLGAGALLGFENPNPALAGGLAILCLAMGFLLEHWGGGDLRAQVLGALYVVTAAALTWRPAQAALRLAWPETHWAGLLPDAFLPALLWLFVREFPRVVHQSALDRATRAAVPAALALGTALVVSNWVPWVGLNVALARHQAAGPYWTVVLGATLPALAILPLRARGAARAERRRVAVFLAGITFGALPVVVLPLLELHPDVREWVSRHRDAVSALVHVSLAVMPVSSAASVLAHEVLGVRVILRRAARRILARSSLALLTALPLLALAAYAARHRDATLAEIFTGPEAGLLAGLAAVAAILLAVNTPLARLIDRLLSHRTGDWPQALARIGAGLREGTTLAETASSLAEEVGSLLHSQTAAVFVRQQGSDAYVPIGKGSRPLPVSSALVALALEESGPLPTEPTDPDSLFRWLPEADRQWVVDTGVSTLVPLLPSRGELSGFLTLGQRDGDEPLTREDRSQLGVVAAATALAIEARRVHAPGEAGSEPLDEPAGQCLACRTVQPQAGQPCPTCSQPTEAAPIPYLLNGKFRLAEVLGHGGMGVAYRAQDLALGRSVALKTLPRVSAEASVRLRAEARSMARLIHPHLALIFGAESWRGVPVLVVEHLPGGTLATRLERPWPPRAALELGLALAGGLREMHRHGLLHRDVKPSNIGFAADDQPKLLDFGLARVLDDRSREPVVGEESGAANLLSSRRFAGTVLYMPPDALAGGEPGPRQDLWALAMVLYEALAGRHPWAGLGLSQVLEGAARPLPPLSTWVADCPPAVERLMAGLLARDRPLSAEALQARLVATLSDLRGD